MKHWNSIFFVAMYYGISFHPLHFNGVNNCLLFYNILLEFIFIRIPAYVWTGILAFIIWIQIGLESIRRLFRPYMRKREAKREAKARAAKREEKKVIDAAKSVSAKKVEAAKAELRKQTLGKQKKKELKNSIFARFKTLIQNSPLLHSMKNQRDIKRQEMLIDYNGADAEKSDVKIMYEYEACTPEGKVIKGYMDAYSKVEVHSFLLSEGYQVYSIKTSRWISLFHGSSGSAHVKIKTKDLIFFLTQLSTYLKAGITLIDALHILARQYAKNKGYNRVFKEMLYDLSTGLEFSDAFIKTTKSIPKITC